MNNHARSLQKPPDHPRAKRISAPPVAGMALLRAVWLWFMPVGAHAA
jgi:hypothetical protein